MSLQRFKKKRSKMANKAYSIDDPQNINAFLALVHDPSKPAPPQPTRTEPTPTEESFTDLTSPDATKLSPYAEPFEAVTAETCVDVSH
jgi:hypothetical protein